MCHCFSDLLELIGLLYSVQIETGILAATGIPGMGERDFCNPQERVAHSQNAGVIPNSRSHIALSLALTVLDWLSGGKLETMTTWQSRVQPLVEATMRERGVPGFVIAVARGIRSTEILVAGVDGGGAALEPGSLFPVASITKLATALAVLRLAAVGALTIDDPLATHLPDARSAGEGITLRMLLSHSSGLPGDLPAGAAPYTAGLDWPALARACLATPLSRPSASQVTYSNVGTGLLAVIVERRTGKRFADALADLVLDPLGIEGYLGVEPPLPPVHIAGDFGEHTGSALEPINSPFWRSLALPWGGLITSVEGALRLVRAFAGAPGGFLPPDLLLDATRSQTEGIGGGFFPPLVWRDCPWGLGVEVRGDKSPHWTPQQASPASFGHVGSTGCLAWVDPDASIAWVMCGARNFLSWWEVWPVIGAAILG
jgi:CubicO group peptidase (beta-lactamase class C family)